MDKKQLLEELEKNIKDFKMLDEKQSMLQIALYQKTIEQIKTSKLEEVKAYFLSQEDYYHQDTNENVEVIDEIMKEYTKQIEDLVAAYDYLYMSAYKNMEKAINSQITTIGDIVEAWDKKEQNPEEDHQKFDRQIIALVQKKVNYSVIVEECKARINWCMQNIEADMNEIFENKFFQLDVYKDGFFERLKRKIMNIISGKKRFDEVICRYKQENLKQIQENNYSKIIIVCATAKAVLQQIQSVENQITVQYEQAVQ